MNVGRLNWDRILPCADYRFSASVHKESLQDFYRTTPHAAEAIAEKRRWLLESPSRYARFLSESKPLTEEAIQRLRLQPSSQLIPLNGLTLEEHALATQLVPDVLLLKRSPKHPPRLVGGIVCAPSSWDLEEKIGKTIDQIHEVVPGLNHQIGTAIQRFLERLQPDASYARENWGLSGSPERNHHPSRSLPRLDSTDSPSIESTWFRLERQSLTSLPNSSGILFGIDVDVFPLSLILKDERRAQGLLQALQTMPDELIAYKGLRKARAPLIRAIQARPSGS